MRNPPKLTDKQKAFVKHIIENPKDSKTEAAAQTYKLKSRDVARSVAAENLAKPSIQSALAAHNKTIETVLINNLTEYSESNKQWERQLSNENAKWLHDKIHGKAVQQSTSVNAHFYSHATDKRTELGL